MNNLKNVVLIILVICAVYLLSRYIKNKKESLENNKFEVSSEEECSVKCNERGFESYGFENPKWCRCPDPASLHILADSGPVEEVYDDHGYTIVGREGLAGNDKETTSKTSKKIPGQCCIEGKVNMDPNSLGYCLKHGKTSEGLYEELIRYACLGDTTFYIVKSLLELIIPNGLANDRAYNFKLADAEFGRLVAEIYQKCDDKIKLVQAAPSHDDYAKLPNDKAFARVLLDKWINPSGAGPELIRDYISKNNCYTASTDSTVSSGVLTKDGESGMHFGRGPPGPPGPAGDGISKVWIDDKKLMLERTSSKSPDEHRTAANVQHTQQANQTQQGFTNLGESLTWTEPVGIVLGTPGSPGPTGATGATGDTGSTGDPGIVDVLDEDGNYISDIIGPQGPPGDPGAIGDTGDPGATGSAGAVGTGIIPTATVIDNAGELILTWTDNSETTVPGGSFTADAPCILDAEWSLCDEDCDGGFERRGVATQAVGQGECPDVDSSERKRECNTQACVPGCADPEANNFVEGANTPDIANPCSYTINVPGCNDSTADNYNSEANVNDGSCTYTVGGCKNEHATNYNPSATMGNPDADNCNIDCEVGAWESCQPSEINGSCIKKRVVTRAKQGSGSQGECATLEEACPGECNEEQCRLFNVELAPNERAGATRAIDRDQNGHITNWNTFDAWRWNVADDQCKQHNSTECTNNVGNGEAGNSAPCVWSLASYPAAFDYQCRLAGVDAPAGDRAQDLANASGSWTTTINNLWNIGDEECKAHGQLIKADPGSYNGINQEQWCTGGFTNPSTEAGNRFQEGEVIPPNEVDIDGNIASCVWAREDIAEAIPDTTDQCRLKGAYVDDGQRGRYLRGNVAGGDCESLRVAAESTYGDLTVRENREAAGSEMCNWGCNDTGRCNALWNVADDRCKGKSEEQCNNTSVTAEDGYRAPCEWSLESAPAGAVTQIGAYGVAMNRSCRLAGVDQPTGNQPDGGETRSSYLETTYADWNTESGNIWNMGDEVCKAITTQAYSDVGSRTDTGISVGYSGAGHPDGGRHDCPLETVNVLGNQAPCVWSDAEAGPAVSTGVGQCRMVNATPDGQGNANSTRGYPNWHTQSGKAWNIADDVCKGYSKSECDAGYTGHYEGQYAPCEWSLASYPQAEYMECRAGRGLTVDPEDRSSNARGQSTTENGRSWNWRTTDANLWNAADQSCRVAAGDENTCNTLLGSGNSNTLPCAWASSAIPAATGRKCRASGVELDHYTQENGRGERSNFVRDAWRGGRSGNLEWSDHDIAGSQSMWNDADGGGVYDCGRYSTEATCLASDSYGQGGGNALHQLPCVWSWDTNTYPQNTPTPSS